MKKFMALLMFIFCISVSTANADVYQYVDKNGVEWFTDDLNSIPDQYHDQLETEIVEAPQKAPAKNKQVEIFVTDWCPYCRKLEGFLRSQNINYKRFNIEKSKEGRREYQRLGKGGVPIIKVGNRIIRGYDPQAILKAVK